MGEYGWMWMSGSTTRWHDEMCHTQSNQIEPGIKKNTHQKHILKNLSTTMDQKNKID